MNIGFIRQAIDAIRVERDRRSNEPQNEDPDVAQQWAFEDEVFINDMCLMMLVALRHEVERELLSLAARVGGGHAITRKQHEHNLEIQRMTLKKRDGWKKLIETLKLESFAEWESIEALRRLANCLKHEPTREPDKELLQHLRLPLLPPGNHMVGYLPLPESDCFRKGLAGYLKLSTDTDYCLIADTFADLANQFVESVRRKTNLSPVQLLKTPFVRTRC